MKKLVIYYSYTGHTKRAAEKCAKNEKAEIFEVKEKKRPNVLKAYTIGSIAAMKGKRTAINPITKDLKDFDKIIVLAPIWAGKPAPAINNVFDLLPSGKEVEAVMVSASGKSKAAEELKKLVESKGCKLVNYQDVKSE